MTEHAEQVGGDRGDYTCFVVAGEEYAISTRLVHGVQEAPAVRRVPGAPGFIRGVSSVRGAILPVIDTRRRFEAPRAETAEPVLVLTRLEGAVYGLLADQVTGVARFGKEAIAPVNPVLLDRRMPFIRAMALAGDRLIHLIDLNSLVFAGLEISENEKAAFAGRARQATKPLTLDGRGLHRRHLLMTVGRESYALPVDALTEIVDGGRIERVAAGPDYLAGVVGAREARVPVIDLQVKYGLAPVPRGRRCRVVVVKAGSGEFGIAANDAAEMIDIAPDKIRETPKAVLDGKGSHIRNVAMLNRGKRLVAVLDPDGILTGSDFDAIRSIEGVDIEKHREAAPAAGGDTVKSFLSFQTAGYEFAMDLAGLVKVIPHETVTPVPKAPAHVRGLTAVRGELVTVTDLKTLLDIDRGPDNAGRHIIVFRGRESLRGLIVDRVGEILHVAEEDLVTPGEVIAGAALEAVENVIRMKGSDRVPMVLNLDRLLHERTGNGSHH